MQVSVSVSVSTRNQQSRSQSRLLRLSGLSLSLESRPDKDQVSVSVSIPKILVSSAADTYRTMIILNAGFKDDSLQNYFVLLVDCTCILKICTYDCELFLGSMQKTFNLWENDNSLKINMQQL